MAQLRPTFSESWYRVAGLKARLRGSTQISRQHYRGERWYVVRDPAGNQYHRLSSAAYRFVGLLDGTRTVGEAWDLVGGQLADDAPTQPEVIQILSQLHAANLLEANITADATVLLRRHKQMRKRQMQGRLMNFLFPRIPLWDPDRFLKRWMPVMRVFLSRFGAFLWLAVIVSACVVLAPRWGEIKGATSKAIDVQGHPENAIWLFLTFVVIKLIHELGHAFSCRRFGGEVHELGIMFLVFIPAPYVDASSAWALPNKWAKAFVGMGGMIFELFVAALLAFFWAYTSHELLLNKLAFNAMLIASVSTVIFNANPLLRYDGYYILSDLLEIPNLRQKSMEYSLGLIKRHVFRVKNPIPLPPPAQRFWLFVYAISSGIYRILVGVTIILVVSSQVPVLGVLMALGGVVTWVVVPVAKLSNYLLLDAELHRKRGRAMAFTMVLAGCVVIAVGVIPFPVHFQAMGMVEPQASETLRSHTPGRVSQVLVRDGQVVFGPMKLWRWEFIRGHTLAVLENDELEAKVGKLRAKVREQELTLQKDRPTDPALARIDLDQLERDRTQLALALAEKQRLVIRPTLPGVLKVINPAIGDLQGTYVPADREIATVQQAGPLVVRVMLGQDDAALVMMKQAEHPQIRLASDRTHDRPGRIERWAEPAEIDQLRKGDLAMASVMGGPAELDPNDPQKQRLSVPQFGVRVDLLDDGPAAGSRGGKVVPGQRAHVRFTLGKAPLVSEWYRKFMQVVQTQSSHNKWL